MKHMRYNKPKVSKLVAGLLRSEMEKVIYEANLGEYDTAIAKMYFIGHMPHADIAAEMNTHRTYITRVMADITPRIERAAKSLYGNNTDEESLSKPNPQTA